MLVFRVIRNDLLRLAARHGVGETALWMLTADEVRRLDNGWTPEDGLIESRKHEMAEAKKRPMPNLISRFSSQVTKKGNGGAIGLVGGEALGRAWVLDEPATDIPADLRGEPIILVAPSVDAGWLPTFTLVTAVAVEMGGNLSHGSIILRELGLPAVTNAAGLRNRIETGDHIRVNGGTGAVERVD
jgi:pyruvate,water dikinase